MTRKKSIVLNGRSYKEMMSIYLERNCAKDATPDQICGDDYAYRPCIAGRCKIKRTVIWHRDSLNQIWNAMTILSSYKIKAGTASVSDAISTNYSDFTANCTSIQVQIHKSLIPCSRSYAILLSCYNSMTLKPMYNTISDAESVNLEISGMHGMIQHDHDVGNH